MDKTRKIIVAIIIIAIAAFVSFAYISANSHNTKIMLLGNVFLKTVCLMKRTTVMSNI